jgi:Asp-tRNA(Asn)/Glu-tRNA(Gln) amidotransferase A subunit family amidase
VPHTRSVEDLFDVLNVLIQDDGGYERGGDFWARQPFVKLPKPSQVRPQDYGLLKDAGAFQGKRAGVPRCMLGHTDAQPTSILSSPVRELWDRARLVLERLGAEVIETDFPLLEKYTAAEFPGQSSNVPGVSSEFTSVERCDMIARGWDDFLRQNGDKKFPNLTTVNPNHLTPHIAPMDDPSEHYVAQNQVRYQDMIDTVRDRTGAETLFDFPGCRKAVESLEAMRVRELHDWMDEKKLHVLVFPTQGDVPFADADESRDSMRHALQDGVKYANGGRALKHLGVPCITVPMGNMRDKWMPVGLTFASKAYADNDLLRYAYAYEQKSRERVPPPLTPALSTDKLVLTDSYVSTCLREKPELVITSTETTRVDRAGVEERSILLTGTISSSPLAQITAFANGEPLQGLIVEDRTWTLKAHHSTPKVLERYPTLALVPRDQLMVVLHAKAANGRSAAKMVLID